jgi:hypothetical protein
MSKPVGDLASLALGLLLLEGVDEFATVEKKRTRLRWCLIAVGERASCSSANCQYNACQRRETEMAVAHAVRDAGTIAPPANLADVASRQRLTPAAVSGVVRLADLWRLTSAEICALIGDVSERTWFRMKKGEWDGVLSQDSLTRISALVGIFKGLRLLFSEQLADEWVRLPNKGPLYGGRRPLDVMIEGGIPKLLQVRQHIDALRGGL